MRRHAVTPAWARALVAVCCVAGAQGVASADTAEGLFDFDLASQPLASALRVYASTVRRPSVFRSEMVAGRTSSALHGRYSAEAALALLLAGTGLAVETVDSGGIQAQVLVAAPMAALALRPSGLSLGDYAGLLQAGVWSGFCEDARTAPGAYRALLRFQVDGAGQVQRPRLLGPSGDALRDAALLEVLQRVRMAQAPPPDFPQPVTLLIEPHRAHGGPRCTDGLAGP